MVGTADSRTFDELCLPPFICLFRNRLHGPCFRSGHLLIEQDSTQLEFAHSRIPKTRPARHPRSACGSDPVMLHFLVIPSTSQPPLGAASGDNLTMKRPPEDRRISTRIIQSRTVRIRPAESKYPEEIRTTMNVSWDGFYFATSIEHYYSGMIVHVTRDFRTNGPANREKQGTVVRVDKLREGRWGIAVQMTRDFWRNSVA
jgi:hypothetical protein